MLRFASSPTDDMHVDDLRIAILNYLVSKQAKTNFLIRIDDGDTTCNIEGKDTEIMQILEKFALIHASVFHQSEHLHMHQTFAIKLLEENKAFVCTCTQEELEVEKEKAKVNKVSYHYSGCCENKDKAEHVKLKESGKPFVLRLKKPKEDIVTYDLIKGDIVSTPAEVDDFIILDVEGKPSHELACACDDMISGISMIINADEYLLSTARQVHIKQQLGYEEATKYAHVPMILNNSGKRMSKNDDAFLVKWLFAEGFIPDAIINYLLLLGNEKVPKEIFTLPEAIDWFSLEDISKSSPRFDIEKLRFVNREHFKLIDDKQLSSLFGFADADVGRLVKLYLVEASTINELALKIRPIFAPKVFEGKWKEEMKTLQKVIAQAPMMKEFDTFQSYIIHASGLEEKNFFTPLRLLLTGAEQGPELSDIYPLIKSYLLEVAS